MFRSQSSGDYNLALSGHVMWWGERRSGTARYANIKQLKDKSITPFN